MFAVSWIVSVIFFVGMFVVIHFFSRMSSLGGALESYAKSGHSAWSVFLNYYAVTVPFILVEVLPFTVLMGAMWAVQQMSRRNELTLLMTSGVSCKRLFLPVLLLAFLIGLGFSVVKEEALPELALERRRMNQMIKGRGEDRLDRLTLIADGSGHWFSIGEYDIRKRTAYNVDILDAKDPGVHLGRISAMQYQTRKNGGAGWYALPDAEVTGGLEFPLATDLTPQDIEIEASSLRHLSVKNLKRLIARNPDKLNLKVLQHAHYVYPLSPLILLLLGLPFVVRSRGRSPFVAAGMSLMLSVAYFSVQSILREMGTRGDLIDPLLGAWLPVVIFGSFGLVLYETMPS